MPQHSTSWRSILAWVFQVVSFPQFFPPKPCIRLTSPPYVLHAPPTSIFSIWSPKQYWLSNTESLSSSLRSFLYSPVTSFLLDLNTLLNTLFSNTLSLHFSLNVSDQVSHPCKTTGNIIVLFIHLVNLWAIKVIVLRGTFTQDENSVYVLVWKLWCTVNNTMYNCARVLHECRLNSYSSSSIHFAAWFWKYFGPHCRDGKAVCSFYPSLYKKTPKL